MDASRWTLGTMFLALILIALFIGTVAAIAGWGLASIMNSTSAPYVAIEESLRNETPAPAYRGKAGNYTYVVYHSEESSTIDSIINMALLVLPALVYIVSQPETLLLMLGASLIVIALEMRRR